MTLEELMARYEERFDDLFPLYCCQGMSDEDIMYEVKACIAKDKPFEPTEGADY